MTIHTPITKLKGGLAGKDRDPNLLDDIESADMLNVIKYTDFIGQRPGRVSYGSLTGRVMGFYHLKVGDTNRFLAVTGDKIYYRTSTGWTDITGAVNFTGSIDDYVDFCTVYDDSDGTFYAIISNGKDNMRKYSGSGDTEDMSEWTTYDPKFVRYYQGYLVGANIIISGNRRPFAFRCSHTDVPNDTTSTNSKTFNLTKDRNISDTMRIEHFGNNLTFYKSDCIYGAWLGSTTNIFEFDVWVHNVGLRSSRGLAVGPNSEHFFLGEHDFFVWPNRGALPKGLTTARIRKRLFEDTDPDALKRAIVIYNPRYNNVEVRVPETYYVDTIYNLDLNEDRWTWWKSERSNITGVGTYKRDAIVTIDDLTGTIDNLSGTIDSLSGAALDNFAVILEGDKDGNVFYDSATAYDDDGVAIPSHYATGDDIFQNKLGEPFSYERVQGFKIEAKGRQAGDRLYIWYSLDEGTTWIQMTTGRDSSDNVWTDYITLTTEWIWYRAFFDVVTTKIRYKWGNNERVDAAWLVRKIDKHTMEREGE